MRASTMTTKAIAASSAIQSGRFTSAGVQHDVGVHEARRA
jgi:hypothetical protein